MADPTGHVAMGSGIRRVREPDLVLGLDPFGCAAAWVMVLIALSRPDEGYVAGGLGLISLMCEASGESQR